MKVIFLKDVKGAGRRDDIKEVSDGYAMNALIPKGFAVQATAEKIAALEMRRTASAQNEAMQDAAAAEVAKKIENGGVTVAVKANEQGHLYRHLSPESIAEAITKEHHLVIEPSSIIIPEPIKALGEWQARVRLGAHAVKVNISVVKEA